MNSVTLWRTIDAPPTVVRESMNELDQFMRASGFDEVHVDGETVRVANEMGIATIELTLELVDRPDADLAYEQRTVASAPFPTVSPCSTVSDSYCNPNQSVR